MRFGTSFPGSNLYPPTLQPWQAQLTSEQMVTIAQRAEAAGFETMAVSDHLFMSHDMAELMGAHWCEAMTAISFLAGATTRMKVYASVLVVPYRHPVLLAKQLASLDYLSGGRVIFGVGIGHLATEFEVLGVPRDQRGPITDEYLEAITTLWRQDHPTFDGEYVSFDDVVFEPRPVSDDGIPLWIGGNSKPALRRVARFGDGWVPWQITPDDLPEALDHLFGLPEFAKDPATFDIVMPATIIQREEGTQRELGETVIPDGVDQWTEVCAANRDAGATQTSIGFTGPSLQAYLEKIDQFAEEVMPEFA